MKTRMEGKSDVYYFHQTPNDLAKELVLKLSLNEGDVLYEPFRGEGSFYNSFPENNPKVWSEITEGKCYSEMVDQYDWVITNPPFSLNVNNKKVNSFWFFLDYFSTRARKGIAFLGNDNCFSALTPKRVKILELRGFAITSITVCSIKKWRGRYFFIVLEKNKDSCVKYLNNNY